jgi:hypothetical protein
MWRVALIATATHHHRLLWLVVVFVPCVALFCCCCFSVVVVCHCIGVTLLHLVVTAWLIGHMPTVVIDNGAWTAKVGFAGTDGPQHVKNMIVRNKKGREFIGDEIDSMSDRGSLMYRRPFHRGLLLNWELQMVLWNRVFSTDVLNVTPSDSDLLLTETLLSPPIVSHNTNEVRALCIGTTTCDNSVLMLCDTHQVVFEHYGFQSLYKTDASQLAALHYCHQHPHSSFASYGPGAPTRH